MEVWTGGTDLLRGGEGGGRESRRKGAGVEIDTCGTEVREKTRGERKGDRGGTNE